MSIFFIRLISSLILLSIFTLAFFLKNELFFLILITIVFLVSLYEMSNLLNLKNFNYILFWFLPFVSCFYFFQNTQNTIFISILSSFFWIAIATFSVFRGKIIFNSLQFLYGFLINFGLFLSMIYLFFNDKYLLLFSLIIVWIADIFAYLSGKSFGKKQLAPKISPGKTYEGVYGAFIASFIFISIISFSLEFSFKSLLFLILVLIPLSIFGDLFESLLKRRALKKDSGNLIPGHGGILDRIDGLCSTIPIIASLCYFGFSL